MKSIRYYLAIGLGHLSSSILRLLGRQASTLPGRLAMNLHPDALRIRSLGRQIVMVSGTNGKTTTTSVIRRLLQANEEGNRSVHSNEFGANLASGMMTTLLKTKAGDTVVLESDEAAFGKHAGDIQPAAVVLTNIFRDQLDRYGELDTIRKHLKKGAQAAGQSARVILCADDPNVASIGQDLKSTVFYYGAADIEMPAEEGADHLSDSAHCPLCGSILNYHGRSMSHLGNYYCSSCDYKRPELNVKIERKRAEQSLLFTRTVSDADSGQFESIWPLEGLYNAYNACGAVACAFALDPSYNVDTIRRTLSAVKPAFGRLERIPYQGKELCFVLVKNPAGMDQGIRLVCEAPDAAAIAFVLNNRVNDGVDVSWIWDAPLERNTLPNIPVAASGERAGDMALRLNYAYGNELEIRTGKNAAKLVLELLDSCPAGKTVYLLPNYSAMMDLRAELSDALDYKKRI